MKTKILLLVLLSVFAASCSQRWCSSHYPPTTSKDSIYIETVKEILVPIPGDSILVEVLVNNCPDQDLVNVETSRLKQQIKILNGKLISNTLIKPDTVFVPVIETETVIREVKVPQPEKYIPGFYRFCSFCFIGIILAGAGFAGFKLLT